MTSKKNKGQKPVQPVPEGYATVAPWIISRNTDQMIDFIRRAFGGREVARVQNPDGGIGHAEVKIENSVVLLFDAHRDWPDTPAFLRLYVPDADAMFSRALEAGGLPVTTVTELAFGDRVGRIRDPQGNVWWIQTHVEDVAPDDMGPRMSQSPWKESMEYVQQSLVDELKPSGVR